MHPEVDLERFYNLLTVVVQRQGEAPVLKDLHGRLPWAARGIYFFFEPGEVRSEAPDTLRVVRVGTHAVSAGSRSTLWGRLRQHRGGRNGGGSHRGSIFRLHTGVALLKRDELALPTWGVGGSVSTGVRKSERAHEQRVSDYLGNLRVAWLAVDDEPGVESDRARIERHAIALLSMVGRKIDPPSDSWLGHHSVQPAIRRSGLWNLRHVEDTYDPGFLDVMTRYVER